ncbi:MAG: NAD+ synthase [Spirochaetaceae bacterium]|jgi:NAD+ synthase (glutamine-hydrolysing)|nr:NAD+ synthase [Spirochaetaceae bacterium]
MTCAIAQINSTVGDFSRNTSKIVDYACRAKEAGAALVLFPELAICGYPPMDLLDQDIFTELNIRAVRDLQRRLPQGIACAVGYVNRNTSQQGKSLVNAYGVIKDGALVFEQTKTLLPTYDVFDEARNFEPARCWQPFELEGERIGFAICEDVWRETETPGTRYACDPVSRLLDSGITMLAIPSASPYYQSKHTARIALAERIASRGGIPIVYINAVGANDSIIFDGRSFILSENTIKNAKPFEEDLLISGGPPPPRTRPLLLTEFDILENALVMGVREYMAKCGFTRCHLGLSGGIDSALVAYLAVQAVGAENVTSFSMPSRFSSQGSKDDAKALAENLGCRYETLPIEGVFTAFLTALEGVFEGRPFDLAEENLQARVRGSLMMAYSNKFNSMLLTTGNKSELAMGYCTLYGDMNGALCPIGDLFKTEVFALCEHINGKARAAGGGAIIPQEILDKPPSAELRPNQKDQDSLPPYDVLDEILKFYLFQNLSAGEIMAKLSRPSTVLSAPIDRELVSGIIKTVARAEFKRRQAPPVLKVSPRAFGMGRRMPIARHLYET